jgi:hypothetical protein
MSFRLKRFKFYEKSSRFTLIIFAMQESHAQARDPQTAKDNFSSCAGQHSGPLMDLR